MLGTHDTFTYLKANNKIYELFSFLWRTQTEDIDSQYKMGVRFIDIRVHLNKNNDWEVCHGVVNFPLVFHSISDILECFKKFKVRIILEKGTIKDEHYFTTAIKMNKHLNLYFAAIKKGWKVIFSTYPYIIDFSYVPFYSDKSFIQNILSFKWFNTIKRWAKKHNPIITKDVIKDKNVIYFLDML